MQRTWKQARLIKSLEKRAPAFFAVQVEGRVQHLLSVRDAFAPNRENVLRFTAPDVFQAYGEARKAALRDRLEARVLETVTGTAVNGAREPRVPNTTNISFDRVEAESLLIALDLEGVAVSTGSACSSSASWATPSGTASGTRSSATWSCSARPRSATPSSPPT